MKGRMISPGKVEGEAIVSPDPIGFYGGIDAKTGIVIEKDHPLEGKCVTDKILVFPCGKGSTVGSYVIYGLKKNNVGPKGIINKETETIVAQLVHQVYNIQRDNADLKRMFGLSYEERGRYFDRLRKEYPVRREFHNTSVKLPDAPGGIIRTAIPLPRDYVLIRAEELANVLGGIGFKI